MKMQQSKLIRLVFGTVLCLFVYTAFYKVTYNENYIPPPKPIFSTTVKPKEVSQAIVQVEDSDTESWSDTVNEVRSIISCDNTTPRTYYAQRGDFWVLYNYVMGRKTYECDESVTYTTHADFTFLDNLLPLLERWQGPLSISLYSPGTDFKETLRRIAYLRECSNSALVKDFVTFHLYFDIKHMPKGRIPSDPTSIPIDCSTENVTFGEEISTYKKERNLTYPVNVGRMIARDMASTYYVLPSDIELYPSPNLISPFLEMIRRDNLSSDTPNKKVFVLPIFEADSNIDHLPQNKTELISMLRKKSVIPFHKYICSYCHAIPKAVQWLNQPIKPGMKIFHVGKREGAFQSWEPIYIGTKFEPGYDERLTWEGRRDKMTQGFALCVLNYQFHILDNAFLIHRPGIKRPSKTKLTNLQRTRTGKQSYKVEKEILPELKLLYGTKHGCSIGF